MDDEQCKDDLASWVFLTLNPKLSTLGSMSLPSGLFMAHFSLLERKSTGSVVEVLTDVFYHVKASSLTSKWFCFCT